MTISREEFKQLVYLYKEAFHKSVEMSEYYNENVVDDMIFPLFNWIEDKLHIRDKDSDFDVLGELDAFGYVPIKVNGNFEMTDDLDKIYDYYLGWPQCLT